jgi:hypothetical protein
MVLLALSCAEDPTGHTLHHSTADEVIFGVEQTITSTYWQLPRHDEYHLALISLLRHVIAGVRGRIDQMQLPMLPSHWTETQILRIFGSLLKITPVGRPSLNATLIIKLASDCEIFSSCQLNCYTVHLVAQKIPAILCPVDMVSPGVFSTSEANVPGN